MADVSDKFDPLSTDFEVAFLARVIDAIWDKN